MYILLSSNQPDDIPLRLSLAEFIEANHSMDAAELEAIRSALLRGESYTGGGGAAPAFTLTPEKVP